MLAGAFIASDRELAGAVAAADGIEPVGLVSAAAPFVVACG
jgi:hypothetical protein